MKSTKKLLLPLLCAASVIGAVLTVLRVLLMDNFYDTSEKLYKAGTDLPEAFSWVFAVAFLLTGLCALFIKSNKFNKVLPQASLSIVFSSAFCGFLFISSSILQLWYFRESTFASNSTIYIAVYIGMIAFGLLSSLYFFRVSSTSQLNMLSLRLTSLFPIIWAICYLLFIYFDSSVVINNPERIIIQLGIIFSMFYFTSEARYHLDIATPPLYFAISLASVIVISVSCIPNIILTVQGIVGFTPHTIYSFLQLGVLSYIVTRLLSFVFANPVIYGD